MIFKKRSTSQEKQNYYVIFYYIDADTRYYAKEEYFNFTEQQIRAKAEEKLNEVRNYWFAEVRKENNNNKEEDICFAVMKQNISFSLVEYMPSEYISDKLINNSTNFIKKKKFKIEFQGEIVDRYFDEPEYYADSAFQSLEIAREELTKEFSLDAAIIYKEGILDRIVRKIINCYDLGYYYNLNEWVCKKATLWDGDEYVVKDGIAEIKILRSVKQYAQIKR
jgi:hypothetical protein